MLRVLSLIILTIALTDASSDIVIPTQRQITKRTRRDGMIVREFPKPIVKPMALFERWARTQPVGKATPGLFVRNQLSTSPFFNLLTFSMKKKTVRFTWENVYLQSGTAAWVYGCRPEGTNDIDAWVMPPPNTVLDFSDALFGWPAADASPDFVYDADTVLDKDGNEIPQADKFISRLELLPGGRWKVYLHGEVEGHSSQTDQNFQTAFFPRNGTYFYQVYETDVYTPYGSMNGAYQWYWKQTSLAYTDATARQIARDVIGANVIPCDMLIALKLKLYIEGLDLKRIPENGPKNLAKTLNDLADLRCMCAKPEGECVMKKYSFDGTLVDPRMGLCAVVDMIGTGYGPGAASNIVNGLTDQVIAKAAKNEVFEPSIQHQFAIEMLRHQTSKFIEDHELATRLEAFADHVAEDYTTMFDYDADGEESYETEAESDATKVLEQDLERLEKDIF
eukprot:c6864_g1_i1.p1 GENE.c6864_g1_i1~~c6864_g1_i1.p1  ORF type:complete len:450 (+),score=104.90 c6864_g1_i1:41-1390(+)